MALACLLCHLNRVLAPCQLIVVDVCTPAYGQREVAVDVAQVADGEVERTCCNSGRSLVEGDDNLVVACRERIVDVSLSLLLSQGRSLVGEGERVGIYRLMVCAKHVVVGAHGHHLIVGIERILLKRIVCHESLLGAVQSHLAARLQNVGTKSSVP